MPNPQAPEPRPAPTVRQLVAEYCDGTFGDPKDWLFIEYWGEPARKTPADLIADIETYALAENKALREALEKISQDEEISYLACPGPPHCAQGDIHYIKCPVEIARAALNPESKPEREQ